MGGGVAGWVPDFVTRQGVAYAPQPAPLLAGPAGGVAAAQAAAIPVGSSGCPCHTWAELLYGSWQTVVAANVRHFAVSDTPRAGYYWAILNLDAIDTDNNGQNLSFFLLAPSFSVPGPLANGTAFQIQNLLSGCVSIAPGDTHVASLNATLSFQAAASPTGYQKIVVPSGWRVAAVETNGVLSAIVHNLILRATYLELPNSAEVPNL
jgi:hypothetical protein